jgi:hypothetical protein
MSTRKRTARLVTAICGTLLLSVVARAGDGASRESNTNVPPSFKTELFKGEFVGVTQILRVMVSSGTNQFLIVVPLGLQLEQSSENRVVIVSADRSYRLLFRMIGAPEGDPSKHDSFRERLAQDYVGAKVTEESLSQAAGHTGPSFDLFWRAYGGTEQFVRVAFIPSAAGTLEFSLISDSEHLGDAQRSFRKLLRGFRSNEKGKIKVRPKIGYSSGEKVTGPKGTTA